MPLPNSLPCCLAIVDVIGLELEPKLEPGRIAAYVYLFFVHAKHELN